jgi:anti-sigma regulatory factor (Ser/Thr protein kinase)
MKQLFLVNIAPEHIPDAAAWVESICRNEGLPSLDSYKVKTCVTEAINNAVEHGFGFGDGNIAVVVWREGRRMMVEVSNDATDRADLDGGPIRDPSPEADRGRGWAIISSWADEVMAECRRGRTTVRFAKNLPN